jgi:signal transduction histidine kinase/ActR/RegA family two-component response regulator
MTASGNPGEAEPVEKWRALSVWLAFIAGTIGTMGLIGWLVDNELLKRVHPSLVTMKANTAIGLLGAALALALLKGEPVPGWRRWIAYPLAAGVSALGLATLAQHVLHLDLGIDQWLFRETVEGAGLSFPGRMGVAASLNFAFIGLALLTLDFRPFGRVWIANVLTLAPAVVTSLVFLYYFYGIETRVPISRYATIALHTVVAFFALCGGLLFARPNRGVMAMLLSSRSASVMAIRVWPAAVFCPIILGWLVVLGQRAGWYGPGFGAAVLVGLLVIVLSTVIWRAVSSLDRLDHERVEREQEIRAARDTAERALQAKDNFLAALSHELRTPLNPALLVASDAMQDPTLSPDVRAMFSDVARNISLEARLIDDLLDLTRVTRGKFALEMRTLRPADVLHDAMTIVQSEATAKNIDLRAKLTAEPAAVTGDAVRLQQVFWNVLKNAVKFTPENGTVSVTSEIARDTGRFVVVVQDSGIGMTPDEIERAFQPFAQGEHATGAGSHRFGGLGLGLTISHEIVRLHGGRLIATSEGRDRGATFRVELPLTEKTLKHAEVPSKPTVAANDDASIRSLRILLVEDHAPTRQTLLTLLQRRRHTVTSAASGDEARQSARQQRYDLVISDIGLPDISGFELMTELRSQHGIRGIALTGYGNENDVSRSQTAGFITHLTKPVRIETLERALDLATNEINPAAGYGSRRPAPRTEPDTEPTNEPQIPA